MSFQISSAVAGCQGRTSPNGGFTVMEVVMAMSVFVLVISGILAAHLVGLRMYQANETKLAATGWSRNTLGKLTDEVRACNSLQIGNVSAGVFGELLPGEMQQGDGLLIYPTPDTNHFIVYFVNHSDQTFRRTTEASGSAVILADAVTNDVAFTARNLAGNILTNRQNNQVIHLKLEFYRPQRFMQDSDYYKLETAVTRRALQ